MSRWSPDPPRVFIGASTVRIVRVLETFVVVPVATAGSRVGDPLWSAALRAVDEALGEWKSKAGRGAGRMCFVIGSQFCRYALVPWNADLVTDRERMALATHRFVETYGEAARAWAVRLSDACYGAPGIACAMDPSLIEQIDALTATHDVRGVSIQPYLMHAFNGARKQMRDRSFWFVLEEWKRRTLLFMESRRPVLLRSWSGDGDALGTLLDREWRAGGYDAESCPVYLHAAVEMPSEALAPRSSGRWTVRVAAPLVAARNGDHDASRVLEAA